LQLYPETWKAGNRSKSGQQYLKLDHAHPIHGFVFDLSPFQLALPPLQLKTAGSMLKIQQNP